MAPAAQDGVVVDIHYSETEYCDADDMKYTLDVNTTASPLVLIAKSRIAEGLAWRVFEIIPV